MRRALGERRRVKGLVRDSQVHAFITITQNDEDFLRLNFELNIFKNSSKQHGILGKY